MFFIFIFLLIFVFFFKKHQRICECNGASYFTRLLDEKTQTILDLEDENARLRRIVLILQNELEKGKVHQYYESFQWNSDGPQDL